MTALVAALGFAYGHFHRQWGEVQRPLATVVIELITSTLLTLLILPLFLSEKRKRTPWSNDKYFSSRLDDSLRCSRQKLPMLKMFSYLESNNLEIIRARTAQEQMKLNAGQSVNGNRDHQYQEDKLIFRF